ncbi:hypothetical protein HMPREF9946_04888 [Acetobacteraceae bacterium AT-5844]|nr:hypothetical protein HMPREF9946_04888 [Acetobacteraceae bacterium AT-5844]
MREEQPCRPRPDNADLCSHQYTHAPVMLNRHKEWREPCDFCPALRAAASEKCWGLDRNPLSCMGMACVSDACRAIEGLPRIPFPMESATR